MQTSRPWFRVKSKDPNRRTLVDEKIYIKLKGLPKTITKVTLCLQVDENGAKFCSFTQHNVSTDGTVDLETSRSVGGTYTTSDDELPDSMALFWSMKQSPGQRLGQRLLKKDVTKPFHYWLSAISGHVDTAEEAITGEQICDPVEIQRYYLAEDVVRVELNAGRLRGALFLPPDKYGKTPMVMDIFGTGGGLMDHRAALMASRSHCTVLAVAFFRYKDLPQGLKYIDLDYFEEAINYLSEHERALSKHVGIIGTSKGADIVMQLSVLSPRVAACVVVNGVPCHNMLPEVHSSVPASLGKRDSNGEYVETPGTIPAWPYLKLNFSEVAVGENGVLDFRYCYIKNKKAALSDDYIFQLEKSRADFLIISSQDDYSAARYTARELVKRVHELGSNCNQATAVEYPGAGHLLEPPYTPCSTLTYHFLLRKLLLYGGNSMDHHKAQMDMWQRVIHFFVNTLTKAAVTDPPKQGSSQKPLLMSAL